MATLKNSREVPPGGWVYVERETGLRFAEDSFSDLVKRVTDHRNYKGLPVDDVPRLIEDQICLGLGPDICNPRPGEDYRPIKDLTQNLTSDMAAAANRSLIEFVKGGLQFNDRTESVRRADICRTCPFNKPASGCSCHTIYRMIELLIPKSRQQPGVSVCMACGCSLQAKVNMPDSVVIASNSAATAFPPWCWQNGMHPLDGPRSE